MRPILTLTQLIRLNKAFLLDSGWRQDAVASLGPVGGRGQGTDLQEAREVASTAQAAEPPRVVRLAETSDAFRLSRFDGIQEHVNVVLPEVFPGAIFAGVKTALETARIMAAELSLPVRVVLVKPTGLTAEEGLARRLALADHLAESYFTGTVEVVEDTRLDTSVFGAGDTWLVTHWTTAHAMAEAVRRGQISARNVVYLIQDYEPGFTPWSTDFALARSTYRAGFLPLVNSSHLAAFLSSEEGLDIPAELVFGPSFDMSSLQASASARTTVDGPVRVFFYGRPSKPRNLFALGVNALELVAERLGATGIDVEFVMAGEGGADVDLGPQVMRNLGSLTREDYFSLLSTVDIGVSLQYSPHPSHPPFDLAISGAICITNEFSGLREGMHENIVVADAEPREIAEAVLSAIRATPSRGVGTFSQLAEGALGVFLDAAVANAVVRLRA